MTAGGLVFIGYTMDDKIGQTGVGKTLHRPGHRAACLRLRQIDFERLRVHRGRRVALLRVAAIAL